MPLPRRPAAQARHQALRNRLLAAAADAIEAGGLGTLRARALAEAAGCAVGAIYAVFPDLDALVLAVNARTLDALAAVLHGVGEADDPATRLSRLAQAYLGYARAHRQRWRALFQHRLPPDRELPPDYAERLRTAFASVEAPLAVLCPAVDEAALVLLARTLFSAVHGIVDLGLDEKLATLPPEILAAQLDALVRACAAGLADTACHGR